jgi:hypothetical protein
LNIGGSFRRASLVWDPSDHSSSSVEDLPPPSCGTGPELRELVVLTGLRR